MTSNKTWFITGAGRGMGVEFAKAALAAGHNVVATGRDPDAVAKAVGESDDLLVAKLDVTCPQDAEAAVEAAVDRFGGIDVLVNNAASFYAGFFEELTPEQIERQLTTSLIGPMNVTRAVLPVMRKQRSGHVVTISSSAGFAGFEYGTAYAASKFGVDGWMESLAPEVEPFGIHATVVNPGFFRTELLTKESTNYARAVDRGLRRAQRCPARVLGGPERPAGRRPGQARPGAADHRRPGAAAVPVHRRRRRARPGRGEARRTPAADRRLPRPLDVPRSRRRPGERMTPTYDFKGQVGLVTGAGSGMGLATATAFAEAGAAVVLADLDEDALRTATDELTAAGHEAIGVTCDVADEAQVAAMVERAVATFGRLDMAFNNAGIVGYTGDLADESTESFDAVAAVNLRGVWNCMKHELRQMRTQGSGAIVNCSSLGGLVGGAGRASYHAAKHGVIGLTKSAALDYAPLGIRINAVCPGVIDTPMAADLIHNQPEAMKEFMRDQPIGRPGRADEIAAATLWLCSPGASFVLGVALPVDGGYTAH